jgi:hypothetical protein
MSEVKGRQTLNVDLGELKPLVLEAAQIQGKGAAAWVREQLARALQTPPVPATRVSARRSGGRWVTATYRLLAEEADALRAGAEADGVSQAEHVGRLALAHDAGISKLQMLDALHGLTERLQALELALQASQQRPELAAVLREVRAQSKRTAGMVEAVSATRRSRRA